MDWTTEELFPDVESADKKVQIVAQMYLSKYLM